MSPIDTYFPPAPSADILYGFHCTVRLWGCEAVNDERRPVTVRLVVDASAEHATRNG